MDQKLAELNSEEMSLLLKDSLVEQGLISQETLDTILSERDENVEVAKKQIQAICYAIDYKQNKLIVFDTCTNETLFSTDMPSKAKRYNQDEFETWGTSIAILGLEEIQKEGDIPFNKNSLYGIAFNDEKTYLYNSDLNKQRMLALTDKYIFGANAKAKNSSLPYDLFLSKNKKLLCISNRDEGTVYIFDIKERKFIHEISIRAAGSTKCINITISDSKKLIYLTDNQSPVLYSYELDTKKLNKKSLSNLGILGNICLTPDEKAIYTIIIKPEQGFKLLNADTFEELKSLPPKGDFFSLGDAPCDLLTLSPDNKNIFYMTYLNDPSPYTPVITVIDIEKNKAVKRFSIKDETKPINLAFKDENPVGIANKSFEEALVEKGEFTFNKLRDLKLALMNNNEEEIAKLKKQMQQEMGEKKGISENTEEGEAKEVEHEIIDIEQIQHEEPKIVVGVPVPKKTKHVIIPMKANQQIKDILIGSFWQKTEIDLTEIAEEDKRLDQIADNIRKKLEYYDIEIIEIKNYFDRFHLETIIQRDYILEMLHEEDSIKRQKLVASPANCMNCSAPMYGAWECPVCGFTYEKPEDAIKKQIASLEPLSNLQKGYFFILDQERGIIIELDNYKIPIWSISKEDMDMKSINRVFRLDNKNTMILDKENNTLVEISPKGRESWKYEPEDEYSKLNNPSAYTILAENEILVADTDNHRIFEAHLDGEIIWEYGEKGKPGDNFNFLNFPTDIQKTYDGTYLITDSGNNRVIELKREMNIETAQYEIKVLFEYNEGFNNPTQAYKEIDGKVLVLDKGNNRLVQVDNQHGILWEFNVSNLDDIHKITNPQSFLRLKNKDILVVGNGKVIEILPNDNGGGKILLSETIESIEARTTYRVTKEDIKKSKAKYGAKAYQGKFGKPKHEELAEKKETKKKTGSIAHYMRKVGDGKTEEELIVDEKNQELEKLIEERRQSLNGKFEGENPHVLLTPHKEVLPLPVLIIDKNKNRLLVANRAGDILWMYGELKEHKLIKPQNIEITSDKTIILTDVDKVVEIKMSNRKIIWKYDCRARFATKLKNGNILLCDEKNFKVIELDREYNIVWEQKQEKSPTHAVRLSNGNTLITASSSHTVREINEAGEVVWLFGENKKAGNGDHHLSYPEHASRLANGNTLITDTKNARILEISPEGEPVWRYKGNSSSLITLPTYSARLKDGNTYIIHSNYKHILEVDQNGSQVWRMVMPHKNEESDLVKR